MRHFDYDLRDLKFGLLAMAGQVEEMITLTEQALQERSNAKAERVSELDKGVDAAELKMDQACIDLLALRAPFASDLRLIASSLKIVPELERIADHCCNIARRAMLLNVQPPVPVEQHASSADHDGRRGHVDGPGMPVEGALQRDQAVEDLGAGTLFAPVGRPVAGDVGVESGHRGIVRRRRRLRRRAGPGCPAWPRRLRRTCGADGGSGGAHARSCRPRCPPARDGPGRAPGTPDGPGRRRRLPWPRPRRPRPR